MYVCVRESGSGFDQWPRHRHPVFRGRSCYEVEVVARSAVGGGCVSVRTSECVEIAATTHQEALTDHRTATQGVVRDVDAASAAPVDAGDRTPPAPGR